jgi:hypothetical protein
MMDFENETYEDFAEEQQEEAESWEEDAAEDLDEEGWEEEEHDDWDETEETEEEAQSVWEKPFAVQEENLNNMLPEEIRLVQQAQEIVRKQQQQEADHFMEKEFLALQKEFPDCGLTEVGELLQTEAGKKALQLWKSVDIPLADAYAATHRAKLQARQNAALRQGILNEMNGKRHLTQIRGGNERTEMPADIRAEFKKYFPNASQKEIEKMYRKNRQQN